MSVTVLSAGDPGSFYRADVSQAMGTVVDDFGLTFVDAQAADDGEKPTGLERLTERSADVVLVVHYSGEQAEPDAGTVAILDNPLYGRLPAVRAFPAHTVDGTQIVGAARARMDAFLDVFVEHLLDARDDLIQEDGS